MGSAKTKIQSNSKLSLSKEEIITDYRIAFQSRQASLLGRKEVLTGKAKFGIFGDGKEIAQLAMARVFQNGDFRSGYYRDQTFMFATEMSNIKEFFAQLYAHTDIEKEPASAGRSMNGHFATRFIDQNGEWINQTEIKNCSADISPTGSQMPRLVGLAYASKLYRRLPGLSHLSEFSSKGQEIAFGTIGNASCAEGMFWESINAAGVLKVPLLMSIWDDGYGISVPNKFQMTKDNISEVLSGFQKTEDSNGFDIYKVKGWDYMALLETYTKASQKTRETHTPSIIHVIECTQPQGHSTSGSHERYKSSERLQWEKDFDGVAKMREWLLTENITTEEQLLEWEAEDKKMVRKVQKEAWNEYSSPIHETVKLAASIIQEVGIEFPDLEAKITDLRTGLTKNKEPFYKDIMVTVRKAQQLTLGRTGNSLGKISDFRKKLQVTKEDDFSSHLYDESSFSALKVPEIPAVYSEESPKVNGFQVINKFFDQLFEKDPRVIAFGEDLGHIGDVNQGFAGLQDKFGPLRISDTGIRECTIIGQAIGMAMRGLRPLAEIQYLDYIFYALQIMSDDLATLQYRTKGGQKAPAIIRTRGHRLEGIWHSGSPMGAVINMLRGMHVCVPRNFVQAAGMYNTLFQAEEPAIVVEVLNGYRLKETLPDNMGEYTVPLGKVEVLREGTDVTIVTYGPLCRYSLEAAEQLSALGIEVEVIDVQTLLPFDLQGDISESLKKTNRIIFLDEDVPGGASAYMLQKVIEIQKGYFFLDSEPRTMTAKAHRPAYGTDGDYWSKPGIEDIIETVYELMNECDPIKFPLA